MNDYNKTIKTVLEKFKVGDKCKIYYNPNNPNNFEFEIRGIVDDEVAVILTKKGNYMMKDLIWFEKYVTKL
jgi:ribosomal protein L21E